MWFVAIMIHDHSFVCVDNLSYARYIPPPSHNLCFIIITNVFCISASCSVLQLPVISSSLGPDIPLKTMFFPHCEGATSTLVQNNNQGFTLVWFNVYGFRYQTRALVRYMRQWSFRVEHFLSSWTTTSFSKRTLLHGLGRNDWLVCWLVI